ncbi:MAG TPA: ATP-dependent helicase [Desulfobaccales bacterium]
MPHRTLSIFPEAAPPRRLDYQQELNPAQYQAVTTLEGPVLVIAGAGSGKTRTLVYRLAYLVEQGVDPGSILLLTFTRKSAQEMLTRAVHLVNQHLGAVTGGTFHSVCYQWLRQYGDRVGYPHGFNIMDRSDQGDLLQMLKERFGFKHPAGSFPKKDTMADIFSATVNKNATLEALLLRDYPQFLAQRDELAKIQMAYWQEKRSNHLMDYDDLLVEGRRLLDEHEDVRRLLSERFQYVMVDEYQDTNLLQADLVRLLAFTHHNVMAVGDDSQSIYSFRGADFRNIMDFPRLFPGTRLIKLEENYRSTQPILDLANAVIAGAREKYTKCLFTRKAEGERPRLYRAADENEQSRLVVSQVQELQRQGLPLKEMAVLVRAGYHSFNLEIELTRAGIHFVKFGGFKFIESAHIKDILAYLRILANPKDALSWHRLLLLVPGVGRQSCARFDAALAGNFTLDAALTWLKNQKRPPQLKDLAALLGRLQEPGQTVVGLMSQVLEFYEPLAQGRYDDYPKRMRDLEQLLAIASRYRSLRSFLNDLTLEPPASVAELTPPPQDYLTVSTIHSAKGLEWDAVFVLWAAEGRFPGFYSQEREDELEEERRLMYVAITRARKYLGVAYPAIGYSRQFGTTINTPSRFVSDIPRSLLEPWRAQVEEW